MSDNLDEVSLDVLQHRLIEEVEAQQRLQKELRVALESEKQLRLENDVLWAHLKDRHPGRITDARDMLTRLTEGGELTDELRQSALAPSRQNRTLRQRVRRKIGTLPGVHKMYHGLKNLRK